MALNFSMTGCSKLRAVLALNAHRFVTGLRQDYDAVKAALTDDWSNGQVEGQVNRLK